MENIPLADAVIAVVFAEFCQCSIGDVIYAVCAVLVVGVGELIKIRSLSSAVSQYSGEISIPK